MTPQINQNNQAAFNAYAAEQLAKAAAKLLTPEQFKTTPRVYFHTHNGAKFHVDLGPGRVMTVMFANHRLVTDDSRVIEQLELVADQPGSFIFRRSDSDVMQMIETELKVELMQQITKTSIARAGHENRQFDPNAQLIPVQTHPGNIPLGMQMVPVNFQAPGTGMQNSFSGTQATEEVVANLTKSSDQVQPPSTQSALARLDALAQKAVEENKVSVDFEAMLKDAAEKEAAHHPV